MLYFTLILCFFFSMFLTPLVKNLAIALGAIDRPNERKVHERLIPRMGGAAIFASFIAGILILRPESPYLLPFMLGAAIIFFVGIMDDLKELSPKAKLAGQLAAALVIVFFGDLKIEYINMPFGGQWNLGLFSIPLTVFWIIGVTNSINLIDGLDGLASGVSSIAFIVMAVMAFMMGDAYVYAVSLLLLVCTLGFLVHNFHPASIFLGDTGSLFLGFMISILSLMGFKNLTFISLIVPILILGVPISDTLFAIIRRITNREPISSADKFHLHHRLLHYGFSHRQSVLMIYLFACIFGIMGIMVSRSDFHGLNVFLLITILLIEFFAEKIEWAGKRFKPIIKTMDLLFPSLKNKS
ncbi:glycosyltransferase family 4 protein [Mesobacillus zeae]|uniref:Undecaprenyl/decaprenyl-phosphate alpha-N-acetylglucosaminyl 1-phosphate transferase n=1 Tax=Mesobacillus zeae TaxID=1917180 RepID=A0A398B4L3_9BACI|nr:MraY family glycosyltransferase [Mesobacillus zeae]RID84855.1 undecaprenyl/decaprenyl-phosphate alpha-N-acetylglucosaminyl 1-phosphate transferase [Mesobacillus zeae]